MPESQAATTTTEAMRPTPIIVRFGPKPPTHALWPTTNAAQVMAAHLDGTLLEMASMAVAVAKNGGEGDLSGSRTVLELQLSRGGGRLIFSVTIYGTVCTRVEDALVTRELGLERAPSDARAEAIVLVALTDAMDSRAAWEEARVGAGA